MWYNFNNRQEIYATIRCNTFKSTKDGSDRFLRNVANRSEEYAVS
jgi:hypothetical protein